jgi:type II secretory pathway component PulF
VNHLTVFRNSPAMWLGAITFRNNRLDIYEQLLAKLDGAGRAAVQSVPEIFGEWAAREKKRGDLLGYVYDYVRRKTSKGDSLAESLRPFIDNDEYLILAGGEVRGDLVNTIRSLLANVEARQNMFDAVVAAMWMPVLGLMSIVGLSIGFGLFLWPEFIRAVPDQYWPGWTKPCITVQLWMGKHWLWMSISLLLFVAYAVTLDRWTGRSREIIDRLPPWSIHKGRLAANVLGAMAALVGAGLSVREAFVMIRDRATPYMRWHLSRIIRRYDSPGTEGIAALRTGLFSRRMMDRVEDAASGRSFDETLKDVGTRSLKLVVRSLKAQAVASSAVIFLIVGVLFIYVTAVVVLGIQDATDAFTKSMNGGSVAL